MFKSLLFIITFLCTFNSFSQEITGQWNGLLKIQGIQLRLVFNISKTETGLTSTMDSPDQGAKDIPTTSTLFENNILTIKIENAKIEYIGTLGSDNKISGTFSQAGQSLPMDLSHDKIEIAEAKRSQNPIEPYPYYSEEVTFKKKKAGVTLSGTLTLPKKEGNYPVVILISGSGPQNRDEELMGHKPFLILSDYLTRNGIGVLRYDDRGTASSTGDFKTATTQDFASDVQAAVAFLMTKKGINKKKIGLAGHSEGGIIAPIVAAKSKNVAFIVLLAGTGIPGDELLLLQQELIGRVSGESEENLQLGRKENTQLFDIIKKSDDQEQIKKDLTIYMLASLKENPDPAKPEGVSDEEYVKYTIEQIATPWMIYFIKYNPAIILEKVKCPVLAINGSKDLQVPPKENLTAIQSALTKGGNNNVTAKELPNLNHLFQECETGSPSEYAEIEQTFSPVAMELVLSWINEQVK
ncbi:MAG: hypothetical protein RI883_2490 [Bacteroidota bacterium]|jgi:fermentation-respiration switch protein FrsA (DUF1100 family)